MKLRSVLLDRSFIDALLDRGSPHHARAAQVYEQLLAGYVARTDRLFALSTVLDDVSKEQRKTALAPILITRVANQHRSAAAHLRDRSVEPEVALSLVMLRRERIHAVATVTHDFDMFDIEVVFAGAPEADCTDVEDPTIDDGSVPDGYVSYETGPLPGLRSTDG